MSQLEQVNAIVSRVTKLDETLTNYVGLVICDHVAESSPPQILLDLLADLFLTYDRVKTDQQASSLGQQLLTQLATSGLVPTSYNITNINSSITSEGQHNADMLEPGYELKILSKPMNLGNEMSTFHLQQGQIARLEEEKRQQQLEQESELKIQQEQAKEQQIIAEKQRQKDLKKEKKKRKKGQIQSQEKRRGSN